MGYVWWLNLLQPASPCSLVSAKYRVRPAPRAASMAPHVVLTDHVSCASSLQRHGQPLWHVVQRPQRYGIKEYGFY